MEHHFGEIQLSDGSDTRFSPFGTINTHSSENRSDSGDSSLLMSQGSSAPSRVSRADSHRSSIDMRITDSGSNLTGNKPHSGKNIMDHFDSSNDSLLRTSNSSNYIETESKEKPDKYLTQKQILAYKSFITSMNFTTDNHQYLNHQARSNPNGSDEKYMDYLLIAPSLIDGYTLVSQLTSSFQLPTLIYHAIDDLSGEKVLIRMSPNYVELASISRFLNEWYILSALNPPAEHRLFSNETLANDFMPPRDGPIALNKNSPQNFAPVTLPEAMPGILYPMKVLNVEAHDPELFQKRMGLVFPNYDYKTLRDYHAELDQPGLTRAPDSGSIASVVAPSIHSMSSNNSAHDLNPAPSTGASTNASGSAASGVKFIDEMANRVRQQPKSAAKIIEILSDVIVVLKTLATIHELGIVHNGITSHSILKSTDPNLALNKVVLIGWDFCFSLQQEDCSNGYRKRHLNEIIELLPYISPEVSGEFSTPVDYRSDFYSIGVVLYELVLGCLPFQSNNLSKLVRMHLLQKPIAPVRIGQGWISDQLSDIILKLLEKSPVNRYRDCYGIINDLTAVKNTYLAKTGSHLDPPYYPEKINVPPVFQFSNAIFGLGPEYKSLVTTYESLPKGVHLLLISGPIGVGKSTIQEDLKSAAISKYELYCSWKFSRQESSFSVYSSFVHSMRQLITQILTDSKENIDKWRDRITTEIYLDLSILFGTMPELKTLLGTKYTSIHQNRAKREDEPVVTPSTLRIFDAREHETSYDLKEISGIDDHSINFELKLRYIIKCFFGLMAQHGLTIFLDDIQFCSTKEWDFITECLDMYKTSFGDVSLKYVAVYGRDLYNNHDQDSVMTYEDTLEFLLKLDLSVSKFDLKPFSLPTFQKFVYDSLVVQDTVDVENIEEEESYNRRNDDMEYVLKMLYDITGGSALYFNYIIRTQHFTGNIAFENNKHKNQKLYRLNPASISKLTRSSVIKSYLNSALTEEARSLLKFATLVLVSDSFVLSDLMIVTNIPIRRIYELLQLCIESRVVVPISTFYKLPFHLMASSDFPFDLSESVIWDLATQTRYRFVHDSVLLELIKELRDSNEFTSYHRMCGIRFYKHLQSDNVDIGKYVTMATHLSKSWELAQENEHKLYFEALIAAARYTASTYNLDNSLKFFRIASHFIDKTDSKKQLKNILTMCHINFYLRNFKDCLAMIDDAEKKYGFDETMFLIIRVRCLFQLGLFKKGLKYAIRGLRKLGVEVSTDKVKCNELANKMLNQIPLLVPEIRKLKYLPQATNPKILMIYELISDLIAPSYMTNLDHLRRALVAQLTILMHTHGVSSYCALGLLEFANSFAAEDTESGMMKAIEFCKLALHLIDIDGGISGTVVQHVYESYVTGLAVFAEPLSDVLKYYDIFMNHQNSFYRLNFTSMSVIVNTSKLHLMYLMGRPISRLMGQNKSPYFSDDPSSGIQVDGFQLINEGISLKEYKEKYSRMTSTSRDFEFCYYASMVYWYSAHGLYEEALTIVLDLVYKILKKLPITLVHIEFYFHAAVSLCRNRNNRMKEGLAVAHQILKKFELYHQVQPQNFAPKYLILRACMDAVEHALQLDILDRFEEAVDRGRETSAWHDVAQGHLLCATWLASNNKSSHRIKMHAKQALAVFKRLDARLFVARITRQFSSHLEEYNWAGIDVGAESTAPLRSLLNNFFGDTFAPVDRKGDLPYDDASHDEPVPRRLSQKVAQVAKDYLLTTDDLTRTIKACLTISKSTNHDDIVLSLLQSAILFSGVDYGVIITLNNEELTIQAIGSSNNIYSLESEPLSSRTDLCPFSLIMNCFHTGDIINRDEDPIAFETKFLKDDYYTLNQCSAVIAIPLRTEDGIVGVMYLENQSKLAKSQLPFFGHKKRDLMELLCSQAAVSLDKASLYAKMELAKRVAEDATAEKASFLANMSHEIRTPFNSLLSCSLFLLDTDLTNTQREYVDTIKNSAMLTLSIIDGILAFSKIEHGSFTLDNAPFQLNECIESAIQLGGEQAAKNDIELVFFNRCPRIETIVGDVTRFRQIIINLVGNSVKFTPKGYIKVDLSASVVSGDRYEILISVKDTGIGIPVDSQSKVFGAFSQVDASSRRVYGGSGLGLAISKKLADIMNGSLTFESEEGQGSTFHFVLNCQANLTDKPEVIFDNALAARYGYSNKAVIIDDHELGKQALKEMLEDFGFNVTSLEKPLDHHDETVIFIHHNQYEEFKRSKVNPKSRIILVAKFGKSLPANFEENTVHCVLLSPFQRSKVVSVVEDINADMKNPKKLGVETVRSRSSTVSEVNVLAEKFPLKILLAEDNLINIKVALQHLRKLGYQADHAKDGVEVLEKCEAMLAKDEKYDVILMDIQMPRKDGIAATIELKESFINRGKTDFLPQVVALTANVAGEDRERSLNCGMVDFISKPILPDELRRVLENLGKKLQND